jgi:peptidoglycan/LPS O-acetylase OafA/YrhL
MEAVLRGLGLDHYQRSAHLNPAILTVLPVFVTLLLWLPKESALLAGLISVAASVALAVLLMQFGRARGRAVQARMNDKSGGLASTRALRHGNDLIAAPSRARYHAFLAARGLMIPSAQEQAAAPDHADEHYRSAADWLREQTRNQKKFALLHGENRAYGFRRNLLGLKPFGLLLTVLSIAGDGLALYYWGQQNQTQEFAGVILAILLAIGFFVWLFVVTESFVEDASRSYTERLLAACDDLPVAKVRAKAKPKKT